MALKDTISFANVTLRGADLSGTNLQHADLTGSDLSGADLSEATLFIATLSGATLLGITGSGATLRQADLSGTNLRGVDLSDMVLIGADLSGATLIDANLPSDYLSKGNLGGADLRRVNFSGEDMKAVDLSGANLRHTNLSETNLRYADLRGAILIYADLSNANLERANLAEADLSAANLSEADLRYATVSEATLIDASLSQADIRDAELDRTILGDMSLSNIRLSSRTKFYEGFKSTLGPSYPQIGRRPERWRAHARDSRMLATLCSEQGYIQNARVLTVWEKRARRNEEFANRNLLSVIGYSVNWQATGYGISVRRVVRNMLLLFVVSTYVYLDYGINETLQPASAVGVESRISPYIVEILYFSVVTFTTSPPTAVTVEISQWIAMAETFLGTLLIVLLGYVLGTRESL